MSTVVLAIGCGDPTIRVYVDSNADVAQLNLRVLRDGDERVDEDVTAPVFPVTLLLENADTADDRDVVVIASAGTLERRARLDFATDDVTLLLSLCSQCAGVTCEEGQTCDNGGCVSDKVDEGDLPTDDGSVPSHDCGTGGGGGAGGGGGVCVGQCDDPGCGDCPGLPDFGYYSKTCSATYCIDSYEVTRGLYQSFLATQGPNETCALTPDAAASDQACTGDCDRHPVVGVPYCAAEAYCNWAQGRLCSRDEWIGACRGNLEGQDNDFIYGATYEPGTCNDGTATTGTVALDVNSVCRVGDAYDMSGNVKEWTADCTSGACTVRGGGWMGGGETQFDCGTPGSGDLSAPVDSTAADLGFRCCGPP